MEKIRVKREIKRLPLYQYRGGTINGGSPIEDIYRIKEVAEAEDWEDIKFDFNRRSDWNGRYNGTELVFSGMRWETDNELKYRKKRECELLKDKKEMLAKAQKGVDDLEKSLGETKCKEI